MRSLLLKEILVTQVMVPKWMRGLELSLKSRGGQTGWRLVLPGSATLPHSPSQAFECVHAARGSHVPVVPRLVFACALALAQWWQPQAPSWSWPRVKQGWSLEHQHEDVCSPPQVRRLSARDTNIELFCGRESFVPLCDYGVHGPLCALPVLRLSEGAYVEVPAWIDLESLHEMMREMQDA